MNKKAIGDTLLFTILAACMIIILLVYVFANYMLFSVHADVRVEESKTISDRLVRAVVDGAVLREDVLDEDFDIFKEAGLKEELFFNGGDFYFSVVISKLGEDEAVKSFIHGTKDFEIQCSFFGKGFAVCFKRELVVLDKSGKEFLIKVLCGSNHIGESI